MDALATRRASLAALAGFLATRALPAAAAASSDLGPACLWAVKHNAHINAASQAEDWSDERLDEEMDWVAAIFDRACKEPSRDLRTLHGKASLCLDEFLAHRQPMTDPDENNPLDELDLLVATVLREVIALTAGGGAS